MRAFDDARDEAAFRRRRLRSVPHGFGAAMWLCTAALALSAPLPPRAARAAAAAGIGPRLALLAWLLVDACASAAGGRCRAAVPAAWVARVAYAHHAVGMLGLVCCEGAFGAAGIFLPAVPALVARAALGRPPLLCSESVPLIALSTCAYGAHLLLEAAALGISDALELPRGAAETPSSASVVDALGLWLALALFVGAELAIAISRERAERSFYRVSVDASRARLDMTTVAHKADRLLAATLPPRAYRAVIAQVAARRARAADDALGRGGEGGEGGEGGAAGATADRAADGAAGVHEPLVMEHEFVLVLHCRVHGLHAHFARGREPALAAAEILAELLAHAQRALALHGLTLVQISASAFLASSQARAQLGARDVAHALEAALEIVRAHARLFEPPAHAAAADARRGARESLVDGRRGRASTVDAWRGRELGADRRAGAEQQTLPPTGGSFCIGAGGSAAAPAPVALDDGASDGGGSGSGGSFAIGRAALAPFGTQLCIGVHCGHVVQGFASKRSTSGASFGLWGDAVTAAATLSQHMPAVSRELGGGRPSSGVVLTEQVLALLEGGDRDAPFAFGVRRFADPPLQQQHVQSHGHVPPSGPLPLTTSVGTHAPAHSAALQQLMAELSEVLVVQGALHYLMPRHRAQHAAAEPRGTRPARSASPAPGIRSTLLAFATPGARASASARADGTSMRADSPSPAPADARADIEAGAMAATGARVDASAALPTRMASSLPGSRRTSGAKSDARRARLSEQTPGAAGRRSRLAFARGSWAEQPSLRLQRARWLLHGPDAPSAQHADGGGGGGGGALPAGRARLGAVPPVGGAPWSGVPGVGTARAMRAAERRGSGGDSDGDDDDGESVWLVHALRAHTQSAPRSRCRTSWLVAPSARVAPVAPARATGAQRIESALDWPSNGAGSCAISASASAGSRSSRTAGSHHDSRASTSPLPSARWRAAGARAVREMPPRAASAHAGVEERARGAEHPAVSAPRLVASSTRRATAPVGQRPVLLRAVTAERVKGVTWREDETHMRGVAGGGAAFDRAGVGAQRPASAEASTAPRAPLSHASPRAPASRVPPTACTSPRPSARSDTEPRAHATHGDEHGRPPSASSRTPSISAPSASAHSASTAAAATLAGDDADRQLAAESVLSGREVEVWFVQNVRAWAVLRLPALRGRARVLVLDPHFDHARLRGAMSARIAWVSLGSEAPLAQLAMLLALLACALACAPARACERAPCAPAARRGAARAYVTLHALALALSAGAALVLAAALALGRFAPAWARRACHARCARPLCARAARVGTGSEPAPGATRPVTVGRRAAARAFMRAGAARAAALSNGGVARDGSDDGTNGGLEHGMVRTPLVVARVLRRGSVDDDEPIAPLGAHERGARLWADARATAAALRARLAPAAALACASALLLARALCVALLAERRDFAAGAAARTTALLWAASMLWATVWLPVASTRAHAAAACGCAAAGLGALTGALGGSLGAGGGAGGAAAGWLALGCALGTHAKHASVREAVAFTRRSIERDAYRLEVSEGVRNELALQRSLLPPSFPLTYASLEETDMASYVTGLVAVRLSGEASLYKLLSASDVLTVFTELYALLDELIASTPRCEKASSFGLSSEYLILVHPTRPRGAAHARRGERAPDGSGLTWEGALDRDARDAHGGRATTAPCDPPPALVGARSDGRGGSGSSRARRGGNGSGSGGGSSFVRRSAHFNGGGVALAGGAADGSSAHAADVEGDERALNGALEASLELVSRFERALDGFNERHRVRLRVTVSVLHGMIVRGVLATGARLAFCSWGTPFDRLARADAPTRELGVAVLLTRAQTRLLSRRVKRRLCFARLLLAQRDAQQPSGAGSPAERAPSPRHATPSARAASRVGRSSFAHSCASMLGRTALARAALERLPSGSYAGTDAFGLGAGGAAAQAAASARAVEPGAALPSSSPARGSAGANVGLCAAAAALPDAASGSFRRACLAPPTPALARTDSTATVVSSAPGVCEVEGDEALFVFACVGLGPHTSGRGAEGIGSLHLDYIFGRPLGRGAFSRVRLATSCATGERVAIKTLRRSTLQLEHVQAELKILASLRGRQIVQLLHVIAEPSAIHLVLEYVAGMPLSQLCARHRFVRLPEALVRTVAAQFVLALQTIHALGVLHRDIKPENAILVGAARLKLVDFGLSALLPARTPPNAHAAQAEAVGAHAAQAEAVGPDVDAPSAELAPHAPLRCGASDSAFGALATLQKVMGSTGAHGFARPATAGAAAGAPGLSGGALRVALVGKSVATALEAALSRTAPALDAPEAEGGAGGASVVCSAWQNMRALHDAHGGGTAWQSAVQADALLVSFDELLPELQRVAADPPHAAAPSAQPPPLQPPLQPDARVPIPWLSARTDAPVIAVLQRAQLGLELSVSQLDAALGCAASASAATQPSAPPPAAELAGNSAGTTMAAFDALVLLLAREVIHDYVLLPLSSSGAHAAESCAELVQMLVAARDRRRASARVRRRSASCVPTASHGARASTSSHAASGAAPLGLCANVGGGGGGGGSDGGEDARSPAIGDADTSAAREASARARTASEAPSRALPPIGRELPSPAPQSGADAFGAVPPASSRPARTRGAADGGASARDGASPGSTRVQPWAPPPPPARQPPHGPERRAAPAGSQPHRRRGSAPDFSLAAATSSAKPFASGVQSGVQSGAQSGAQSRAPSAAGASTPGSPGRGQPGWALCARPASARESGATSQPVHLSSGHVPHAARPSEVASASSSGAGDAGDAAQNAHAQRGAAPVAARRVGTPPYMAPEVVRSLDYSVASEYWALGCVIFELVTAERLFDGPTVDAVLERISQRPDRSRTVMAIAHASMELKLLIAQLVAVEKGERLGVDPEDPVREHVFFTMAPPADAFSWEEFE